MPVFKQPTPRKTEPHGEGRRPFLSIHPSLTHLSLSSSFSFFSSSLLHLFSHTLPSALSCAHPIERRRRRPGGGDGHGASPLPDPPGRGGVGPTRGAAAGGNSALRQILPGAAARQEGGRGRQRQVVVGGKEAGAEAGGCESGGDGGGRRIGFMFLFLMCSCSCKRIELKELRLCYCSCSCELGVFLIGRGERELLGSMHQPSRLFFIRKTLEVSVLKRKN